MAHVSVEFSRPIRARRFHFTGSIVLFFVFIEPCACDSDIIFTVDIMETE